MAAPPPSHSPSVDPFMSPGAPGGPGMGGPVGGYPQTHPSGLKVRYIILNNINTSYLNGLNQCYFI